MTIGLILSGGIGSRMHTNGIPKQYLKLCGHPVISYSLRVFNEHSEIDGIVIVADAVWQNRIATWMKEEHIVKFTGFALPGATRQYSILNGLKAIAEMAQGIDYVVIHDAARPLLTSEFLTNCLRAVQGHDGMMPVLPAKDTFYLTDENGKVAHLLPRARLVAGQTPEIFAFEKYYQVHLMTDREKLLKINGSTEIAVANGMDIVTVEGDERNIKLTTPNDMELVEKYLEEKKE